MPDDIKSGFLPVYKPRGVGSTEIVTFFKKLLKPKKIGHTGTLDPMAEGVLILAINEATKAIQFTENKKKIYEFNLVFGTATDSLDADGNIIEENDIYPEFSDVERILPKFTGKIKQIPPKHSALKINGVRAYDLARKGKEVEIKEREVEIYNLKIISYFNNSANIESSEIASNKITQISMRAKVSRGTYIRTLAADIATELGAIGHINYLNRFTDGVFSLPDTLKLPVDFWNLDDKGLQNLKTSAIKRIADIDVMLDDIPVLHLEKPECAKLRNGLQVSFSGLAEGKIYKIFNDNILHSMCQASAGKLKVIRCFNL